jgi:hypothetical protein
MKEILFRGISKETGEYTEGDLLTQYGNEYKIFANNRAEAVYRYSVEQKNGDGWENIGHGQPPKACCFKEKKRLESLIESVRFFADSRSAETHCPTCENIIEILATNGKVKVIIAGE